MSEIAVTATPDRKLSVRFYRASDREAVRRICGDTGFLGNPIDPMFEDRELFADYLTQYYTDIEPESTLVCEVNGVVSGYLMGCRRPVLNQFYHFFHNLMLVIRGAWKFRHYNAASKKFVSWIIKNGWREVPAAPRFTPHFHINLLPEARNVTNTRALIDAFLDYLTQKGEKAVYGQMVTYEMRRGERMFARYGFKVIDQVEVTKYRDVYPGQIFLFTVLKDLTLNPRLYGTDLHTR